MKFLIIPTVIFSLFISSCNQANRDEINDSDNLYISSLTPTHGSSVGKNPIISITFSEEIDSSTVDNSTIKIKNSTGTQIGGTLATSDNKKINYSLNSNLDEDTYTITFSKNIKTESNKTIAKEYESNFIVSYTNDKWIQATSSAAWSARRAHASVVFNDKIWIIGGYNGSSVLSDVWYSSNGVNWVRATTSGPSRRYATALVYNDKIWIIGGSDGTYTVDNLYNSSDGITWNEIDRGSTDLPGITSSQGVVFDNKMYLFGGWNGSTNTSSIIYSINGTNWTTETNNPGWSARRRHMSLVFNNKIWIFGGIYDWDNDIFLNDVWNSINGSNWNRISQSSNWSKRWGSGIVTDQSKIWLIGGNLDQNIFYTTNGSNWKNINVSVPTNSQTRWKFTSVYFNNKIWILGGYDNTGNFNDVWYW